MSIFRARPVINKKTGQATISIPKKAMSKRELIDINSKKKLKFYLIDGKK